MKSHLQRILQTYPWLHTQELANLAGVSRHHGRTRAGMGVARMDSYTRTRRTLQDPDIEIMPSGFPQVDPRPAIDGVSGVSEYAPSFWLCYTTAYWNSCHTRPRCLLTMRS